MLTEIAEGLGRVGQWQKARDVALAIRNPGWRECAISRLEEMTRAAREK